MRTLVLPLLLCAACSTASVTRSVSLTIINDTKRPEKIRATIRDVGRGKELFSYTASLLPGGAVELGDVVEVENRNSIQVCSTLIAYPDKDAHMCRVYVVAEWDRECMVSAVSTSRSPPIASVSCWDMLPVETP